MSTPSPKIFISYSHDSPAHRERVRSLADRLRSEGVDCTIDQYVEAPPEPWPQWMQSQIEDADFVLVVFTATYLRRATGKERPGAGHGVRFESVLIVQDLYDAAMWNEKFIPVLFEDGSPEEIIKPLRGYTCYRVATEDGYEALYRRLTGQPRIRPPDLGDPRELPPDGPVPSYPDDNVRELSQALEAAYLRQAELITTGDDPTAVRDEILDLRRRIREGGQLKPGDFLLEGRFKLLEPIGRGGFATVWKAFDRSVRQLVAIKVLHGQYAQDRTRRERFFRGARKMAELHHPGIVRVIEAHGEDAGYYFFAMDYAGGGDLRQAVLAGRLSPEDRLRMVLEVGDAVDFAHQHGVIHRDVKPANILLAAGDRPMLTDFDLVRAHDTTGGTRTGMLGTVIYAAPELMDRPQDAGVPADVYGLGMTAIFALHGADLPLEAMRDAPAFVERIELSTPGKAALARAVAWKVEERWGSVAEFCRELRKGLGEKAVSPPAVAGEERRHERDGTVLVYVPGGEYTLGTDDVGKEEKPVHRVRLSPYRIGKFPVTNEQYRRFLEANSDHRKPRYWDDERFNQPRQPVVGVSWDDAEAYCRWAGLLLPTEAQWEAAARGTDGRRYPWGHEEPTPEHANFDGNVGKPSEVGAYPGGAGPFGTLDQAGNVWEWCRDVWDASAYRERDGQLDPIAKIGEAAFCVLRGGSWAHEARFLAAACRLGSPAGSRVGSVGFRCVLPVGPEP